MIKILGAGISGLTAAINLAKAGEGVMVYEKCPYVGGKINPNLQVFENWVTTEDVLEKLNEIGIRINFSVPFRKIVVWSPGLKNKAEIIGDTKPVCYGVIRGGKRSFEFELAKQAKKCGAKIVTNFKRKVKPNIDASGSKRADGIAYGKVFKGKFDSNELIGFFDYRYAPKGYLYIFPHSRRIATIGIATRPH
jgi:flavin-dependent dehydrogenase